ncbi:MAG TPA: metallophosphoesterase [Gemmatimonadales bacterium]|nr:metallophosphoesterase [Gemmatimonadales bacterium]
MLLLLALACRAPVRSTPPPADAPPELVALSGASILIGAGDIARCNSPADEATAAIVDSVLKADSAAKVEDAVFTLGDNAYPDGSERDFSLCFSPSWGDTAKRIISRIRPSPGNHEHETEEAAPYYKYFGDRAGSPRKGYYSYDLGEWHVVVLNSEIVVNRVFSAKEQADQEEWLREDLKGSSKKCTVAYFHHPRYSSGWHGGDTRLTGIWRVLYEGGADLVLVGHDHHYERFQPLTPLGTVDTTAGIVQILAGTGGGGLRNLRATIAPFSAFRLQGYYGVVKLTLGKEEWRSAFIDTNGTVWDPAGGKCH